MSALSELRVQRPPELGTKAFYEADEVAAVEQERRAQTNADRELPPGQVGSWRAEMDARHLTPPFPQLDRPVYAPEPGEAAGTDFVRPAGNVPAAKMRGTLEERGWRRLMHDQGGITGFSKAYPAANVTAVVNIEPWILIGMSVAVLALVAFGAIYILRHQTKS